MSADVETTGTLNLPVFGAEAYTDHPETDAEMLGYQRIDDPSPPKVWLKGQPVPEEIVDHVRSGGYIAGWNFISFDRRIWERKLVPLHGFPEVSSDKFLDTMHLAAAANLPRSLDGCAKALGVPYIGGLKDNTIIRRITNKNITPIIQGADLEWLIARCQQDVVMESETFKRLPPWFTLPPWNRMREIDRLINDRGILLDLDLIRGMAAAAEVEIKLLNAKMKELTNGVVSSTSVVEKLKVWLMSHGVKLPLKGAAANEDPDETEDDEEDVKAVYRLRKSDIADLLARDDVPDICRTALEIRQEAAKASVKKLRKMITVVSADGRLRGSHVLGGAQNTFRFSSKDVQSQNLIRDAIGTADDIEEISGIKEKDNHKKFERVSDLRLQTAIEIGRRGDRDEIENIYFQTRKDQQDREYTQSVLAWIGRMSRRTIAAPRGMRFLNGDFAQIEARIPFFLAQQEDKIQAFRDRKDLYRVQAAPVYGIAPDALTKQQRQIGKVMSLACGFHGGVGAFSAMAQVYGVRISREAATPLVSAYRDDNPRLKEFWYANLQAAVNAVMHPGSVFSVEPLHNIAWCMDGNALLCRLPSGRMLRYWQPRLEQGFWPDGRPKSEPDLTVLAIKGRAIFRRTLWTGLATENCLAWNVEVLTNAGWKPIIHVTKQDKIWDGDKWVSHDGVVYQGCRETIDFGGVRITSEHKVLINDNWTCASDTTYGNATASYERHHRTPFQMFSGRKILRNRWPSRCLVVAMRLRQHKTNDYSGLREWRRLFLWLQNIGMESPNGTNCYNNSRYVASPGICCLAIYAGSLSSTYTSSVEKLRRAGNHSVRPMAAIIREFLGRYGAYVRNGLDLRQTKQQFRLHSRELSLGYADNAEPQQKNQCIYRYAMGMYNSIRSLRKIWNRRDNTIVSDRSQLSCRSVIRKTEFPESVYDIRNAGPQARFTVRGTDGKPFIVSNCTQAIAADMLATALVNMHDAGLNTVLHVHDSITVEIDEKDAERRLDEFERCMLSQPSWTEGLPIAVTTDISTRFG